MMLFCMKGMFSGNKHKQSDSAQAHASQQEIQQLQIKMADLMEQNHKQMQEIEALKAKSSSNVIKITDEQLPQRGIS